MNISNTRLASPGWLAAAAAALLTISTSSAVLAAPDADLDIIGFTATSPVAVNPPDIITLTLTVANSGTSKASGMVLIEGRRTHGSGNGKVFNHPFPVEAEAGGEPVVYEMVLEDFAPQAGGIDWIATIKDGRPDAGDVATATTVTIPATEPPKHGKVKVKTR